MGYTHLLKKLIANVIKHLLADHQAYSPHYKLYTNNKLTAVPPTKQAIMEKAAGSGIKKDESVEQSRRIKHVLFQMTRL